jgi:transposase InsO family protein
MPWKKILAYTTGQIEPVLLQKLEYVLEENRVYRALLQRHPYYWRLKDDERIALAEKGKPLGKLLKEVIAIVQPETLLKWHRQLIARKWDFSDRRQGKCGRLPVSAEVEELVVRFARENPAWGYDRIAGALANLGHIVSDQTVGNILKAHSLGPTNDRKRGLTWAEFIRRHKDVLWATDFFTAEIWTQTGLTTVYVLFFIQLQTRRIILGGLTRFPSENWMKQIVRNISGWGETPGEPPKGQKTGDNIMSGARYLLHDRDTKFSESFGKLFKSIGIEPLKLPPKSPNLNAFAERWVRSIKEECLNQLILFGERSLRYVLSEYIAHYHHERNHQGLGNVIPFPDARAGPSPGQCGYGHPSGPKVGKIVKTERIGGLLNFYHRQAA